MSSTPRAIDSAMYLAKEITRRRSFRRSNEQSTTEYTDEVASAAAMKQQFVIGVNTAVQQSLTLAFTTHVEDGFNLPYQTIHTHTHTHTHTQLTCHSSVICQTQTTRQFSDGQRAQLSQRNEWDSIQLIYGKPQLLFISHITQSRSTYYLYTIPINFLPYFFMTLNVHSKSQSLYRWHVSLLRWAMNYRWDNSLLRWATWITGDITCYWGEQCLTKLQLMKDWVVFLKHSEWLEK